MHGESMQVIIITGPAMAGLDRQITDPFLKRSVAALIVVSNALLAFLLFEHGGAIEGLLYDSRLLVANGMSPIVAMKLQRAWSSITRCTLQHPYLRTLYSVMLADGLYGDTVLMQVPWLLSSFFETSAQLVLILASLWIMVLHLEPMTVPHVLSVMTQLLLIQLYSGMWTLVALWTFQSSIEEMIEVIAASRGPTIVLSYDPNTQRMTAREMSPPRMGRWGPPSGQEPQRPRPIIRQAGHAPPAPLDDDDGDDDDELQSQDDASDYSDSQTSSQQAAATNDKRSSEGITRGPQIERDSVLSDEESTDGKEKGREATGPSAGRERESPSEADKFHSEEIDKGVELITLGPTDRPASHGVEPSTRSAQTMGSEGSSKAANEDSQSGCRAPQAACRGPAETPVATAAIGESAAPAIGSDQTHGVRPGFRGCNVPDAACQEKQTGPPDSVPGFTKIVDSDTHISKRFIPCRPTDSTDVSQRAGTSPATAADATRSESQGETNCDPKDGVTICPGSGQPTRPQGWICPPGSQCRIKEVEIRSTEPEEGKPKVFKDELPLHKQVIVIEDETDVMSTAQQRIAEEATEAIPIHFTEEHNLVPLDDGEIVVAGDIRPMNLTDGPPEEQIDDLFSNSPTEGGEDRLRGGEQPLDDNSCFSHFTCRVCERQCPMHAAMRECFKVESDVDASDARIESSVSAEKTFFREEDDNTTCASEASGFFPSECLFRPKELDFSVLTEGREEDKLSIGTKKTYSPGEFCSPNEQEISMDIRADDVNFRVCCEGDTLSNSATHNVLDVSNLPSEGKLQRESTYKLSDYDVEIYDAELSVANTESKDNSSDIVEMIITVPYKLSDATTNRPLEDSIYTLNTRCSNGALCEDESCCAKVIMANPKVIDKEEILLDQVGTVHITEDNVQPNTPKEPSVIEEHVSFDDRSLNKVDSQAAIRIKYAVDTACNAYRAPEMQLQPGDCESPPNSIFKKEEEAPGVESLPVILKHEMNERSISNGTEHHIVKEEVSLAYKKNWMCPPENITRMDDVEDDSLKDVCPGVGDKDFSFPHGPGFDSTSCPPAPHFPEMSEEVVETIVSEVPTSDQPDEETVEMFFDVVELADGYPTPPLKQRKLK